MQFAKIICRIDMDQGSDQVSILRGMEALDYGSLCSMGELRVVMKFLALSGLK